MVKRYNYVIEETNSLPYSTEYNYFRARYTDFCGVVNWDKLVPLEEATICSTQQEAADLLLWAIRTCDAAEHLEIKRLPYTQKTFRSLTHKELDLLTSAYIVAAGCKNRVISRKFISKNKTETIIEYVNEDEKNVIKTRLQAFNTKMVNLYSSRDCTSVVYLSKVEELENNQLAFVISENTDFEYRNGTIHNMLVNNVFPYLYSNILSEANFINDIALFKDEFYKRKQYSKITKEEKQEQQEQELTGKRKYNLPKYITWDIRNTALNNCIWFNVVLKKDGKITSTKTKTVKAAMDAVAENRVAEKIWTQAQANEYLATYTPDYELGWTVEKAKETAKLGPREHRIKDQVSEKEERIEEVNNTKNDKVEMDSLSETKTGVAPKSKRLYNLPKYVCYDKAESRNRERTVFQTSLKVGDKIYKNNLYTVKDAVIDVASKMLKHTDIWSLDTISEYLKTYDPEMENGTFIPSDTPKSPSVIKRDKNKNIRLLKERINAELKNVFTFAKNNGINININLD